MGELSKDELVRHFTDNRDSLRKKWVKSMQEQKLLSELSAQEIEPESARIYDTVVDCLRTGDFSAARDYARALADQAVLAGMSSDQIMIGLLTLRDVYGRSIHNTYGKDTDRWSKALDMYEPVAKTILGIVSDAFVKARENQIRLQQEALLELSTPVNRIWDKVLLVPLIGTLDSSRAKLVMETLLQRIVETQSRIVILDIAGIPSVDTMVANHLLRTVTAARLLGTECIVTGVSARVAQTVVHIGVDLSKLTTRPIQADGLVLAFEMLNLKVTPK